MNQWSTKQTTVGTNIDLIEYLGIIEIYRQCTPQRNVCGQWLFANHQRIDAMPLTVPNNKDTYCEHQYFGIVQFGILPYAIYGTRKCYTVFNSTGTFVGNCFGNFCFVVDRSKKLCVFIFFSFRYITRKLIYKGSRWKHF